MVDALVKLGVAQYNDASPFRDIVLPRGLFLFIPQRRSINTDALLHILDPNAQNWMENDLVEDKIVVPEGPYLMTKVRDGSEYLNVTLSESEQRME